MSRSKGRRVPPTPEQLASWRVTERQATDDAAWKEAEHNRTIGPRQLAAGVVKHPDTGLYQVYVSLYGTDVTCWTATPDRTRADQDVDAIYRFFKGFSGGETDILAFMERLIKASPAEPAPLPDDLVRVICMQIARAQQRRN